MLEEVVEVVLVAEMSLGAQAVVALEEEQMLQV
jgi:hypothetical protein